MRSSLLIINLICLTLSAAAQLKTNMGEGRLGGNKISWDDQFIIIDKNGANFHSYYDGVQGHPFFIEEFKNSTIKLVSGEEFSQIRSRLDICKHTIQIRMNGDTAKTVLPGNVSEVIFYDTIQSTPRLYKFQAGYPSIDNFTSFHFYQLLSDGKVGLLKASVKKINKLRNEMSGELTTQFDTYEDYYLYIKYEMKRVKKDKEYLLNLLADKKRELEKYVSDQKTNFKSIDSIKKLIDHYNSL